jgi:hypothetical protein
MLKLILHPWARGENFKEIFKNYFHFKNNFDLKIFFRKNLIFLQFTIPWKNTINPNYIQSA